MGNNGFKKEYITGRKDQWDIDYANPLTENGRKRWLCGYWWKFTP